MGTYWALACITAQCAKRTDVEITKEKVCKSLIDAYAQY